jgi:hypothetical protein
VFCLFARGERALHKCFFRSPEFFGVYNTNFQITKSQ